MGRMSIPAVRIETRPLKDLRPAPYNPRRISDRAMAGLRASVERFGLVQPIILNERTGHIVGGHQRLKVLEEAGKVAAQVVVVDLPESEERALNVALNNPHIAGEFTEDLHWLLAEIQADEAELYESLRLGLLEEDAAASAGGGGRGGAENGDNEEGPLSAAPERASAGDIWALGRHRLIVDDCRSPDALAALLDGAEPDVILFDPPFQWERVYDWLPEARPGVTLLCFSDAFRLADAIIAANGRGWVFRWEFVWDGLSSWFSEGRPLARHKVALMFGPGAWDFDAGVFVNGEGETKHLTTVFPRANNGVEGTEHAKPAAWVRAMLAGAGASTVLDMCAGSGTGFVAAEPLGATVYGCEISPSAADTALARWEERGGEVELLRRGAIESPTLPKVRDPRRRKRSSYYRTKAWRELRAAAIERDGGRCVECGAVPKARHRLQVDHVIPRNEGGPDTLENLRTLCHECHSQKTGRTSKPGAA